MHWHTRQIIEFEGFAMIREVIKLSSLDGLADFLLSNFCQEVHPCYLQPGARACVRVPRTHARMRTIFRATTPVYQPLTACHPCHSPATVWHWVPDARRTRRAVGASPR